MSYAEHADMRPGPVQVLAYAGPGTTSRRYVRTSRALLLLTVLNLAIVPALIGVDVESIVVTGPILATIGALMVYFGFRGRWTAIRNIGIAHLVVTLGVFLMIALGNMSKHSAFAPVMTIAVVYGLGVGGYCAWLFVRNPVPALALSGGRSLFRLLVTLDLIPGGWTFSVGVRVKRPLQSARSEDRDLSARR